jgi:hypothetical protein
LQTGSVGTGLRCVPLRHARSVRVPACRPPPQKRCPTAFQQFPNAREVVLASDAYASAGTIPRVEVLDVFRLPRAPADAAAARATLAGVTRLEVRSGLERVQLAAALLHLPGLRAVSLLCDCELGQPREVDETGDDLVATLAGCPALESLEWEVDGWLPAAGAFGSRGKQRRTLGWAGPRGFKAPPYLAPRVLGVNSRAVGALLRGNGIGHWEQARPRTQQASKQQTFSQSRACPCPNVQMSICVFRRSSMASPPRCRR